MSRKRPAPRDQEKSSFGAILQRLCESVPALAAALVDDQGEAVDYAGSLTPYEVKVAAAEWQLVIRSSQTGVSGGVRELLIRTQLNSFAAYRLPQGYVLVLRLPRGCCRVSFRPLSEAVREICVEAGFTVPSFWSRDASWSRVDVREQARRPAAIFHAEQWHSIDVIGRYHGPDLLKKEQGFRVRLENGLETTLVRERMGRWYSDHLGGLSEICRSADWQPSSIPARLPWNH